MAEPHIASSPISRRFLEAVRESRSSDDSSERATAIEALRAEYENLTDDQKLGVAARHSLTPWSMALDSQSAIDAIGR